MISGYFRMTSMAAGVCLILGFCSCDQIREQFSSGKEEVQEEAVAVVDSGFMESILLTRVDQLRMRHYPNVKSNIVTTMDDNMPIRYMGEETDFEESIGKFRGNWKGLKPWTVSLRDGYTAPRDLWNGCLRQCSVIA